MMNAVVQGRVLDCTVLGPRARHFILCLELVQLNKTVKHLNMTEKLLTWMLNINTSKKNLKFDLGK